MKLTAEQIIEQAHATGDLVGLDYEGDDYADKLWEFAYHTWSVEDGDKCTLRELEEAFNEPMGCPTGG